MSLAREYEYHLQPRLLKFLPPLFNKNNRRLFRFPQLVQKISLSIIFTLCPFSSDLVRFRSCSTFPSRLDCKDFHPLGLQARFCLALGGLKQIFSLPSVFESRVIPSIFWRFPGCIGPRSFHPTTFGQYPRLLLDPVYLCYSVSPIKLR